MTICPFTTDPTEAPLFRLDIETSAGTGLHESRRLMVDKVTTVRRSQLGERFKSRFDRQPPPVGA